MGKMEIIFNLTCLHLETGYGIPIMSDDQISCIRWYYNGGKHVKQAFTSARYKWGPQPYGWIMDHQFGRPTLGWRIRTKRLLRW
jgi:hypothetical protein